MTGSIRYILMMIGLSCLLISCQDRLEYTVSDIPEGNSSVRFKVTCDEFTPSLETRSAGQSIESINSLWMLVYNTNESTDNDEVGDFGGELLFKKALYDIENGIGSDAIISSSDGKYSVTVKDELPNGRYRIYAVANMDLEDEDVSTVEKLRKLETPWQTNFTDESGQMYTDHVKKNSEMFGWFVNKGNGYDADNGWDKAAPIVEVSSQDIELQAKLYRCASKITLAYDGSGLNDGVSIYLMGVTIKDIPNRCALGVENIAGDEYALIEEGEQIVYYKSQDAQSGLNDSFFSSYHARLDDSEKYFPRPTSAVNSTEDRNRWKDQAHAASADALFFYENMQGEGKNKNFKYEEEDNRFNKPDKPLGTYIEVEAIYRQVNKETLNGVTTEKPESGIVKYRFMLGQNTTDDYNAKRNHHYKLTLKFNGSPKDYEWHIEYSSPMLEVSDPKVFDYRGKVFMENKSIPNGGHVFSPDNIVTVRSYIEDGDGSLEQYTIKYKDEGASEFSDESSWLKLGKTETGRFPYEQNLYFNVKPRNIGEDKDDVREFKIDDLLKAKSSKGTKENPFNLANPSQGAVSPAQATIQNTANCYMVDAPGYYLLPLVYGNAIENGDDTQTRAYIPTISGGSNRLGTFKNHLGNDITSPYIRKNADCNPVEAVMMLQDENNLINYNIWDLNESKKHIEYLPNAYPIPNSNNEFAGAIKFYIDRENIKQGNVILALVDKAVTSPLVNQGYNGEIKVLWSWHIWVTDFSIIPNDDKTIKVTTGVESSDGNEIIDFMPVNLGWCSAPDDVIKYYPGRKCEVEFASKSGKTDPIIITIEQKSHIAVTRGNNLYYQWGRKDPFMGSANNETNLEAVPPIANKPRYLSKDWSDDSNYAVLNGNVKGDENRKTTAPEDGYDSALADLISYPYKWHNPPRKEPGYDGNKFQSINKTYSDLWGGGSVSDGTSVKTIYDPCPVGYKVPHPNAFTGFTTGHDNSSAEGEWYDAREFNIENAIKQAPYWEDNDTYYNELYEFYTNPTKTQSIIFPVSGYRDWDNGGYLFNFGIKGFAWSAVECTNAWDLSGENYHNDNDWIFNFDFARPGKMSATDLGFIRPKDIFFSCDGFPVRPVKE